jgi:hypothetical protein
MWEPVCRNPKPAARRSDGSFVGEMEAMNRRTPWVVAAQSNIARAASRASPRWRKSGSTL